MSLVCLFLLSVAFSALVFTLWTCKNLCVKLSPHSALIFAAFFSFKLLFIALRSWFNTKMPLCSSVSPLWFDLLYQNKLSVSVYMHINASLKCLCSSVHVKIVHYDRNMLQSNCEKPLILSLYVLRSWMGHENKSSSRSSQFSSLFAFLYL